MGPFFSTVTRTTTDKYTVQSLASLRLLGFLLIENFWVVSPSPMGLRQNGLK